MAVLEFKAEEVARIVRHALEAPKHRSTYGQKDDPGPALWLVVDHGVYLMSNGDPGDQITKDPPRLFVSFASGCNPIVDDLDTWYGNKVAWFGGDDGVDALPWCKEIGQQLLDGAKLIRISVTSRGIRLLEAK